MATENQLFTTDTNAALKAQLEREERSRKKRLAGPWLHAWHHAVANIHTSSNCMRFVDITGDGDHKLVVADQDRTLKIFKGTSAVLEKPILFKPGGMTYYYPELSKPQIPSIAVGAGPYILIYRNLAAYYRFYLPPVDVHQSEQEVWSAIKDGKLSVEEAVQSLSSYREEGVKLTNQSVELLTIQDDEERARYMHAVKDQKLLQMTVVTCMETINLNMPGEKAVSMLVVGTESGCVLIMDPSGTSVLKKLQLPSTPVFIATTGFYEVEYRIVVACRDANIYTIKKGKVIGTVIELETQPVGLAVVEKNIVVASMDSMIHTFHFKGKKVSSIYLDTPVTNLCSLSSLRNAAGRTAIVVTCLNGEVRIYNKKTLVSKMQTDDLVTAVRFGQYGREEGSMALVHTSGALSIKMLQRTAKLDVSHEPPGPPPEQDIPLDVPKKTKLYIEQTKREKDQAVDMHRIFQRELCTLRLNTARSYVKTIQTGTAPFSTSTSTSIRLDAKVQGLGPVFKLKIAVKNTGKKAVDDVPVAFSYDHRIHKVSPAVVHLPLLVPSLEYFCEVTVECIDPNGASGDIRVFVCSNESSVPIISAIVNFPTSEIEEEED